ncbi:TPA: phosphohistidine phosphatase SixA [Haemophilus influenzae]|uniref:phosphohistidine phosphatase SixA n=1 Tax=Haemophilus influenzae TaxID=727 RepID=UPI001AE0F855|nr:phosphohistidine phosphatase SixA [Haemophilus influenzae]MBZ5716439.1 phosphohistidine phosphatase SixA [Haemophilus influenzae]
MNIFIMRHGEAEVIANSDKSRRLTAYGIKQAFSQGEWLKQHLSMLLINSLDRILVSPYVRAQETFHQVNQAFDLELENKFEIWEGITPYGHAHSVIDYLEVLKDEGVKSVLIISHLPLVGEIVAELYGKRNPISFYPATIAQLLWDGNKSEILMHQASPVIYLK